MKAIRIWSCLVLLFMLIGCVVNERDFRDGSYTGGWKDGVPQGYGCYVSDEGSVMYEGNWEEGLYHGYGLYRHLDTCYYGFFQMGRFDGEGTMCHTDGHKYCGRWKAGKKSGYGEWEDGKGNVWKGVWQADTLRRGALSKFSGTYHGAFDHRLSPHGEGWWQATDGGYYAGSWVSGERNGFGFSMEPDEVVKCGIWKNNRFLGERMLHTSQRVYGIDISKYQHLVKRKEYAIDWDKLRIIHLGHIGKKEVQGKVDYPVSFVYIKATEGLTVTNPYYLRDVRAARAHGYPVGAYHFMSSRPANRQAVYFLKKAALKKGDLPPMLDVEFSDRQIQDMGGIQVVFRNMLAWLRVVEHHCGTLPVLYLSQSFVNKYMPEAPEVLKTYPVWIARYGEYKPYVHLQYWQLSPDGSVRGVHGEVDIDVFNGTMEQFEDYVRTHAVSK